MSTAIAIPTARPARRAGSPRYRVLALVALVAVAANACRRGAGEDPEISSPGLFTPKVELQLATYLQRLARPPLGLPDPADRELTKQVRAFYSTRGGQPAWFAEGRLRPEAEQLVGMLGKLDDEGLDPTDYNVPALTTAMTAVNAGEVEPGRAEELEVGLTWAALLAASHLRHGRVSPEQVGNLWEVRREPVDLGAVLAEGLESGQVEETLRRLDPDHPQFVGLLQALRRYRDIAARGGWPTVPTGPVLAVGEQGDAERLRALARRLQAEGFLAALPAEPSSSPPTAGTSAGTSGAAPTSARRAEQRLAYGPELAAGVRRFQRTRTLKDDGRLGEETQEELNVPVEKRLQQLRLNLERWRWVPDDFGTAAVVVNVPGFTLDVEENRRIVQSMAVVVGEEGWETPAFADRIEYLVVNPYWNVPSGILEKEILPAVQRNPGYLAANDMEVVRGDGDDAVRLSASAIYGGDGARVRQRPGPRNPLGQIKFMFPNDHDIYLHDTPADHLFKEPDRSASHGCIRVERPGELAAYLLRGSDWAGGKLQAAIASGRTQEVPLPRKTPVFILYFTAAVRPDGQLEYYEDIYGFDAEHARARGGDVRVATAAPPVTGRPG